jgi:N-acetylmuramoyl-L-alanine amidase
MNPLRHPVARALAVLLVLLCALGVQDARAAAEWQVIKVGRWDYLSLENVAKFYGFDQEVVPVGKTIRLDNGTNQLEVTLDSRDAVVNGVRNWLCFPVVLHSDGKYLISRIDLAKTVEPQFRPQMIKNLGKLKTVVLDPGHGGVEKGAASAYGLEKDYALDVALQLKPMLEAKGLRVIMTRDRDMQVPLPDRARIANATRDSIFVSIHFNSTDSNRLAAGFEIFSLTPRGAPSTQDNAMSARFANMQAGSPVDAASLVLSTSVYHSMLGHMPEFDRGVKRARFAVLRLTNIPAILVEGGFLSEREESKNIANREWRTKLAASIAVGIENYRGLVERRQRPMMLADYRRQLGGGVLVARNATAPPDPVAAPPVIPASNIQVTSPVRREPSPQLDVPPQLAAAIDAQHPPKPDAPDPAAVTAAAIEEGNAIAAAENANAPIPGTAMSDAPPPPAVEVPGAPTAEEVAAKPSQNPPRTRTYWILKFAPPPKFHP